MTVYVDEFFNYGRRIGRAGPSWSHLMSDTSDEELHKFAQSIGLKREWHQSPPEHNTSHYDIGTKRIRDLAVKAGATEIEDLHDKIRVMKRLPKGEIKPDAVP